jgi:ornithine carbamoyltransferase
MQHRKAVRHLLTVESLRPEEIREIFTIAHELKARWSRGENTPLLAGRVMALLFEKPSLRTRVSFQAAMAHLGGTSLYLGAETGFGKREQMADFVRVLCRYVDVIVLRAYDHSMVEQFASYATASVINGLTDYSHPCQALADLFTIEEHFGTLEGQKVAYVGDANNVARSLAMACAKLGVPFVMATPPGYRFPAAYVRRLIAGGMTEGLTVTEDPAEAVRDATVVYTDVWTSMGQEAEAEQRRRNFAAYQVNEILMAQAAPNAIFMHCMPAHRGEEVTDGVMDGPQSVVLEQAANRLHVQKGILVWILGVSLPT